MTELPAPETAFCLTEQAALECFDDGALILRVSDRHLFELNITGRDILALTDGKHTVAQIAASLADAYQVPVSELVTDILELYAQLTADRLIAQCCEQ